MKFGQILTEYNFKLPQKKFKKNKKKKLVCDILKMSL